MLKTIAGLQGVTVLSKDAQKKISGGQTCSMTWQDANGVYHTEYGTCSSAYIGETPSGTSVYQSFCSTTSFTGPVALSSNGGVSRCGGTWTIFS